MGASSLAFGELAAAALAVGQPGALAADAPPVVADKDAGQGFKEAVPQQQSAPIKVLTRLTPATTVVVSSRAESEAQSPATEQVSPGSTPLSSAGGLIRPLSLAPDAPPESATNALSPQPVNSTPSASDGGAGYAASSGAGVTVANLAAAPQTSQAANAVNDSAQTPTVVVADGAPQASSNHAFSTPVHAGAQSATERIAAANSIASRVRHHANRRHHQSSDGKNASTVAHSSGGIPLGNGRIATGGSLGTVGAVHSGSGLTANHASGAADHVMGALDSGSGTGSGTGSDSGSGSLTSGGMGSVTGSGTGSGSSIAGGSSSGSGSSSYATGGGTYSVAGSSTPAGFQGAPIKGNLQITPNNMGSDIIGARVGFTLSGGGAQLSNIKWSSSGAPIMYSGQPVPNPTNGDKKFDNQPYNIGAQTGATSISFNWGAIPGRETITASATVTINGKSTPFPVAASRVINVGAPGWSGDVIAQKEASIQPNPENPKAPKVLRYMTDTNNGISWATVKPSGKFTGGGSFQVVQIWTSGSATVTNNNVTPPKVVVRGFFAVNSKTNPPTYTPAPFPLDEVRVGSTTPFYFSDNDNPWITLFTKGKALMTSNFIMSFVDYVMFRPSGENSIWVPEATFMWTINATATPKPGANAFIPSIKTPVITQPLTLNHTDWPQWNDVSGKYLNLKRL